MFMPAVPLLCRVTSLNPCHYSSGILWRVGWVGNPRSWRGMRAHSGCTCGTLAIATGAATMLWHVETFNHERMNHAH